MNPDMHLPHHDKREHSTYEDGIDLSAKEKMIIVAVVAGLGLLMLLTVIGIGF